MLIRTPSSAPARGSGLLEPPLRAADFSFLGNSGSGNHGTAVRRRWGNFLENGRAAGAPQGKIGKKGEMARAGKNEKMARAEGARRMKKWVFDYVFCVFFGNSFLEF